MLRKMMALELTICWRKQRVLLAVGLLMSVAVGVMFGLLGEPVSGGGAWAGGLQVMINRPEAEMAVDWVIMLVMFGWMGVFMAIGVQMLILIKDCLCTRMFGKKGYLTHLLPLEPWQLAGSKLAACTLQALATGFAFVLMGIAAICTTFVMQGMLFEMLRIAADNVAQMGAGVWQSPCLRLLEGTVMLVSLLAVYQFVLTAVHGFRRFRSGAGIVLLVVLFRIQAELVRVFSWGWIVALLMTVPCFMGSCRLLRTRLNLE